MVEVLRWWAEEVKRLAEQLANEASANYSAPGGLMSLAATCLLTK
jgi:hypothetical protein